MGGVEGYIADGYEEVITDDILQPGDVDVLMGNPKRDSTEAGLLDSVEYLEDVARNAPALPPMDAQEIIDLTGDNVGLPLVQYGPQNQIVTTQRAPWSRNMAPEFRAKQFKAAKAGDLKGAAINKKKADRIEWFNTKIWERRAEDLFQRTLRASQAVTDQTLALLDETQLSNLEGGGVGPRVIPENIIEGSDAELNAAIGAYDYSVVKRAFEALSGERPKKTRNVDGQSVGVYAIEDFDREARRIQGGRSWGGVSGRSYRGTVDNPLGRGTVDIYDGAAVSSGVNIPGVNMDRPALMPPPTPQPAQPATYGVGPAEDEPETIDLLAERYIGHNQGETFMGRSVRVASDWQKEAAMRHFMGSDFAEKPGLYANM